MIPTHAYNASILRHQGKLLLTYRQHDRKDWRTSLHLCELDEQLQPQRSFGIEVPPSLADNSHEDARLFHFRNELWMSWTCSQYPAITTFRCVIVLGKLVQDDKGWKVENYIIPTFGNNNWKGLEKNWVPFEVAGALWCYYETKANVQTFIRLDGDKAVESVKSRSLDWGWGPIHGGAICEDGKGNLLHFFNSRTGSLAAHSHRYHIGVAELSGKPPFDMLRISSRPVLYGQEGYNLDGAKFFKQNVVFACGAISNNGNVLLAHGWNDSKCRIVKLNPVDFKL